MKLFLFLSVVAIVVCSCGSSSKTEEKKKDLGTKCYRYTDGKDSILLSFQEDNSLILGELEYKLYEKDKNSGGIRGVVIGDTIFAEYNFFSEGKESTREVSFLKKDSVLMEGYGETSIINGRQVFSDKKKIQYDSKIYLSEVDCNN
jgi:hypothetical protein